VTQLKTHYARSGDVVIAYQVAGSGPLDVVFVPGFVSHLDIEWDLPGFGPAFRRLSSFARLIVLDKRGTGLSDRTSNIPTLEERMDDVRAVMDAAGSQRAALVGLSEGGPMALLFAATYPERTTAVVLWGSYARTLWAPDYPIGVPPAAVENAYEMIRARWGDGRAIRAIAFQDAAADDATRDLLGRFERNAATPTAAVAALQFGIATDVRHVLSTIAVPTLVVHRTGDPLVSIAQGRYVAEHIPGAKFVELPGDFHIGGTYERNDDLLDVVEEFLTGTPAQHAEVDRILATVLFTDIVASTERAAASGDRRWRDTLDAHDAAVRRELVRFRGRELNTTGDGFFAAFDGPARAIRCALAIVAAAQRLGLAVRAGVHTGECESRGDDLTGLAVHIGARVAGLAEAHQVLVTSTVRDLVIGSGLAFDERGTHTLRGVPGEWRVFGVRPPGPP
jgi:class 3 adenylate cyclase